MRRDRTNSTIVNPIKQDQLLLSEPGACPKLQDRKVCTNISFGLFKQEYYSINELAVRWRVSRGTVYNRLRSAGAKVLDFSSHGKRSKKAVHASVVLQIEAQKTKKLC